MARKTTPESLYGTDRDLLREQERKNEILAQLAGETYTPPGNIPKGGYILKKRALDAAQKENELLGDIAESGSMTDQITDAVTDWLDDNVDPVGSAVVVDSTLTISGAAADAKVTGDAVADLKNAIDALSNVYNYKGSVTTVAALPESGNEDGDLYVVEADGYNYVWSDGSWVNVGSMFGIGDGTITEDKFSDTLKLKTIKDYVTPEMYGAVGDGETDDSEAVQNAIDNGKYVLCLNTYLVKDIVVNKETHIWGGVFKNNGSSDYVITIDNDNSLIYNISLNGCVIDGNNSANGIKVNYCDHAIIENCEVKNIKTSASTNGIYINRSFNTIIRDSIVHNVTNDNSQATRGILSNRSVRTTIQNCVVHDVTSGDDADGVQLIFDGAADETDDGCVIRECKLYNCAKRYIKIQQRKCIVEDCTLLESDSTISASDASIALYDSDCIIRNNYINGNCITQLALVGTVNEETVFENTLIEGNTVKSISTDSSFALIGSVSAPNVPFKNLSIINNTIIGLSKFFGISFRNLSGDNLVICNNNFEGLASGVLFRYDTGKPLPTINNILISNNNFKEVKNTPIYVQYTEYKLNYISVIGNAFSITTGISGKDNNVIIINTASYDIDKIAIENNIGNGYDGWIKVGSWANRPSGVPNGYTFYCTSSAAKRLLTYYNGDWYKPDGTVYSG